MNALPPSGADAFAALIETAARQFCGEVNTGLSSKTQLRFGSNGSLSVEIGGPRKGVWFDHETGAHGGVLDLLRTYKGLEKPAALDWLKAQGARLEAPQSAPRKIVARYDYRDETGKLLFQVLRYEPKDFRQIRPGFNGKGIGDVRRVLYRLPELIAADPSDIVYVVEGEKDVDRLRLLGLVATSNPQGAAAIGKGTKWRPEFNQCLVGRDVVILPDNDDAGEEHATAVATSLVNGPHNPSSVRIVRLPDLPPKGDVSDWLDAGGTVEQLRDLVAEAYPFEPLKAPTSNVVAFRGKEAPKPAPASPTGDGDSDGQRYLINEDSLALVFTDRFKDELRYCHHHLHWFVWSGSVWEMNLRQIGFTLARDICRHAASPLPVGAEKNMAARASTAAAVERMAKADRVMGVDQSTWDTNPWLLGTPDGTVDLKSGILIAARQSDAITKKTAVVPAPAGTPHPLWSKFLDEATAGDVELVAFLQRLVGYALTGDVSEEKLAFLYGEGGTGKGTFLRTITSIMGDYAVAVPIELFTVGSRINPEYYRAQMAGARLVTASETEQGQTWAEAQLKELTGNETPLSARHPYGKAFTYFPTYKLILVGNNAPRLKGRSVAMERRLRIVPFKNLPTKEDHSLKERLRAEYPAILRWAIEGCVAWQHQRLGTCEAVRSESQTYFEEQDHFGRWLEERCIFDVSLKMQPKDLLADYQAWAKESNEIAMDPPGFREHLARKRGVQYVKVKGKRLVKGVGLKPATHSRSESRYGERDDYDPREGAWEMPEFRQ